MSGIGSSDDEEFKRVVGDMLSAAELDQTRQVRVLELAAMLYVVVLAHSDVQISAACKCQICVLHAHARAATGFAPPDADGWYASGPESAYVGAFAGVPPDC